jgi:hypothetical protein
MSRISKSIVPAAVLILALAGTAVTSTADEVKPARHTVSRAVIDKNGNGVEGATVTLYLAANAGGAQKRAPVKTPVKTDKDGKFSIPDVAAGNYDIFAILRGAGAAGDKITVADKDVTDVKLVLEAGNRGGA